MMGMVVEGGGGRSGWHGNGVDRWGNVMVMVAESSRARGNVNPGVTVHRGVTLQTGPQTFTYYQQPAN